MAFNSFTSKPPVSPDKPTQIDVAGIRNPKLKGQTIQGKGVAIGIAPTHRATSGEVSNVAMVKDPYMREKAKEFRRSMKTLRK